MAARRVRPIGRSTLTAVAATAAACLLLVQCGKGPTEPTPSAPGPSTPTVPAPDPGPVTPVPGPPVFFSGAGDIANCNVPSTNHQGTANLLEGIGGRIFTLGDNAYSRGLASEFQGCYNTTWGRPQLRARTYPSPGNHDYGDTQRHDATPYYSYFENAGPRGLGYYSYDHGDWHIISMNSNYYGSNPNAGEPGPAQMQWLQADLAANRAKCTLAYWHHPVFSSGPNGPSSGMRPVFRALYEAGADVVLTGHDHIYEVFNPQNADGQLDNARGIRQFVVGTGGTRELTNVTTRAPNSAVVRTGMFGILMMTLSAESYSWEFRTVANGTQDSGSAACH